MIRVVVADPEFGTIGKLIYDTGDLYEVFGIDDRSRNWIKFKRLTLGLFVAMKAYPSYNEGQTRYYQEGARYALSHSGMGVFVQAAIIEGANLNMGYLYDPEELALESMSDTHLKRLARDVLRLPETTRHWTVRPTPVYVPCPPSLQQLQYNIDDTVAAAVDGVELEAYLRGAWRDAMIDPRQTYHFNIGDTPDVRTAIAAPQGAVETNTWYDESTDGAVNIWEEFRRATERRNQEREAAQDAQLASDRIERAHIERLLDERRWSRAETAREEGLT